MLKPSALMKSLLAMVTSLVLLAAAPIASEIGRAHV